MLLRLTFGTPGRRGRFLSLDYAGLSRWQPAHSNHSQITGTTLTHPFLCHPSHFLSASPLFPCVRCAGVVGYGGLTLSGSFSTALPRIWPIPSGILGFTSRSTLMQRWQRRRRDPENRSQERKSCKGESTAYGTEGGGRTLSGPFSAALPRIWPIPSGILGFTSRSTRMQRWRRHRRDPEYRSQNANRAKGGRVRSGTQ